MSNDDAVRGATVDQQRIQDYLGDLDNYGTDGMDCWTPSKKYFEQLCRLALIGLQSETASRSELVETLEAKAERAREDGRRYIEIDVDHTVEEILVALKNAAPQEGTTSERAAGSAVRPQSDGGHTVRSPSTPVTETADAKDAERYRWLKDAAGRTYDELAGAQLIGQLDRAIDNLKEQERV